MKQTKYNGVRTLKTDPNLRDIFTVFYAMMCRYLACLIGLQRVTIEPIVIIVTSNHRPKLWASFNSPLPKPGQNSFDLRTHDLYFGPINNNNTIHTINRLKRQQKEAVQHKTNDTVRNTLKFLQSLQLSPGVAKRLKKGLVRKEAVKRTSGKSTLTSH